MGTVRSIVAASVALTFLMGAAPPPPQPTVAGFPCAWEDKKSLEMQVDLAIAWEDAQAAAGITVKGKRPRVCVRGGAPLVTFQNPDGSENVGWLCGYYEQKRRAALVVVDDKICDSPYCTVRHEFLHAIMGSGHVGHAAVMEKMGCKE